MRADELMNVVDAANCLGIRPWTLRHWISDGVNGERRSYALLRPIADVQPQARVHELVPEAFSEYEERAENRIVASERISRMPPSWRCPGLRRERTETRTRAR